MPDLSRGLAIPLLLLATCFAFGVFFLFSGQSLRLDESQSLWQTSRPPAEILAQVAEDVHVPLYHELLRAWRLEIGDSVESARFLSRLFFLFSIPMLYVLGSYVYDRKTGLFAAVLLAISPFMNWYGDEIRMYTLFALLAIINQYFFLRILRGQGGGWGYFASALLGAYSHYFFFLILFTQSVFYLVRREAFPKGAFPKLARSWVAVFVLFIPWAWYVLSLGQASNQQPALPTPSTVDLFSSFAQFFFGFVDDRANTFALSLWPVLIIFAFLSLRKTSRMRPETEYLFLSVFLPVALVFLGSLFVVPLFVSRYLIFVVPALFLLVARLVGLYPRPLAILARFALVLLMLGTLGLEAESPLAPVKEDYRGVTTYLSAHAAPQDVVLLAAPFTLYPVEYYYRGAATLATLPNWDQYAHGSIPAFNATTLPAEVASTTAGAQNVFVLLSYDQGYNAAIKSYFDTHYERIFAQNFSPGLALYEYKLRYDTTLGKQGS